MQKKPEPLATQAKDSVEFLRKWNPDGPWVLTAIAIDQKGITTETFQADIDSRLLEKWITNQNKRCNIYFHVNPVMHEMRKKAQREDIKALAWLHVDVDPRAGEDLEEEQERALRLLTKPPGNVPPPTVVVFSGGGYQGFWKLREPFEINGDLMLAEEAKRWNQQLEILFEGDDCHNIDRIMRLPGTINKPNAKKRKKGRVDALAYVVEFDEGRVYDLEMFTPAPAVQDDGPLPGSGGINVNVGGNVERLDSVDDLPEGVPDHIKVLIVQGKDPDDPKKYKSRSHAVWAVLCALVRAECTDEQIYAVITDKDFAISGHIHDQHRPHQYALKQIRRAREHAIHPELAKLNKKHAVIGDIGGKCRVISEVWDPALKRPRVTFQPFGDFRNRYLNRRVVWKDSEGNDKVEFAGHWWLKHPNRRSYETMVFAPGRETPDAYNLWRGFNCEAIPGDCDLFLDHVRKNICDGDEACYDYVVGWMARTVQQPDTPGYTAIVLRGAQGTGKSVFAKEFGSLFGHHFLPVSDPKHLVGSFNAHLRDCVVLFGDEAFYAGDLKHASVLKMLITEEVITVEAKGVDAISAPNCVHLIMASNEQHVVPTGVNERRFLVLEVGKEHQDDTKYFGALREQMKKGGREALLAYLLSYDLSKFDVRRVPHTRALQQQKLYSLAPEEEWWYTKLREGRVFPDHQSWERNILVEELMLDYSEYTRRFGQTRRSNSTRLGHFLKRALPDDGLQRRQLREAAVITMPNGKDRRIARPWVYVLPGLDDCRGHWDAHFGGPFDWPQVLPDDDQDEQAPPPF